MLKVGKLYRSGKNQILIKKRQVERGLTEEEFLHGPDSRRVFITDIGFVTPVAVSAGDVLMLVDKEEHDHGWRLTFLYKDQLLTRKTFGDGNDGDFEEIGIPC